MEWFVLNWNIKAIDFYSKMGAYPMSEWSVYRMDRKDIEKLAEKKYQNLFLIYQLVIKYKELKIVKNKVRNKMNVFT